MLQDLPKEIQNRIIQYLSLDNFVAAKHLHDIFLEHKKKQLESNWNQTFQYDLLD